MPRQAMRLVLGRSAEAKLTSRLRSFSTGPRLRADDDGNRKPTPNRRERSSTAASALGALSRSSEASSQPSPGNLPRSTNSRARADLVRPPAHLGTNRPNNVISLQSLPQRTDGAPRQQFPQAPGKFLSFRSVTGRKSTMGGGRLGGRPGAGRGGLRKPGDRRATREKKPRREREKDETAPIPLSEDQQAYMRETEMGVDVPYKASISPSSLVGWGPAVATNTSTGVHEIALRNMRILAGGRAHSEGEQTFDHPDVKRWLGAGTPIYFSRMEQKEGMFKMLRGHKKDSEPIFETKMFQGLVARLRKEHGDDYGAFVKAFNAQFNPVTFKQAMEAAHKRKSESALTARSGTVKEAIAKYAIKGEHPTIQYGEDTYSRLASYYARGSTYRPADAAKFDAKMKTLVAS